MYCCLNYQGARFEVFEMLRLYVTRAKGADIRSKALQVIESFFFFFLAAIGSEKWMESQCALSWTGRPLVVYCTLFLRSQVHLVACSVNVSTLGSFCARSICFPLLCSVSRGRAAQVRST